MSPYEVLGVAPAATEVEIRRAYLHLARQHHPDYFGADDAATRANAARRMQEINEAWSVLSDARKRRAYDADVARGAGPGPAPGRAWRPRSGDDAWMDDFAGWAEAPLLDDDVAPTGPRRPFTMVPVILLGAALACFSVGLVMNAPGLLATSIIMLVASGALFVLLPIMEMARSRHDE